MADEEPITESRRRGRGAEATARAEALERLKALRSGGRRSESGGGGGYEIKLENPIYDTVGDEEYDALVAKRKEEARGFIVDDDGLGYGDEGEEEDWSKAGLPPSSDDDESDGEGRSEGTKKQKKKKKRVEKKERDPNQKKSNSGLLTAAAMMGKQRISSMFTSSVFKKSSGGRESDKVKGLVESESIVDDVIAKFAPDDKDRESRRRGHVGLLVNSKTVVPSVSYAAVINSVKSESLIKEVKEEEEEKNFDFDADVDDKGTVLEFDDSFVVKDDVVEVVEKKLNAKIMEEVKDPALSATAGFKAAMGVGNGEVVEVVKNGVNGEGQGDFEVDAEGSMTFYKNDAHKEFYGPNMGNIYLFGKVI